MTGPIVFGQLLTQHIRGRIWDISRPQKLTATLHLKYDISLGATIKALSKDSLSSPTFFAPANYKGTSST